MITARILCIAGGGNGADTGGGGAGGFRDESGIELADFESYEVEVGIGGGASNNGGDSWVAPVDGIIESSLFTLSNGFSADSETANIASVANGEEVWVEVVVSGTQEYEVDGVSVSIQGVGLAGLVYDGIYHYDVTSIVAGRTTVDLVTSPNSCSPTVTFKFSTGYKIKSIGGGHGGTGSFDSDGDGEKGKFGGSGGGGGTADSNESGGAGGSAVPGQGYAGGSGAPSKGTNPSHDNAAGGGGGAGGVGGSPTPYGGRPGGVGLASDITGSSIYYAGGGAGYGGSPAALGTPGNGQSNAGGGGNGNSEAGKNGVVIIRYTRADVPHTYLGGTITDVGGDRIHTFTSSGTLEPFLPSAGALALI